MLSAIVLATATPAAATDSPGIICDDRIVVLPGEQPLGTPCPSTGRVQASEVPERQPGEIVVTGSGPPPGDPLAEVNAQTFEAMDQVDKAVIEPIAHTYRDELPKPVRKGLGHFFRNLREPVVALNFLLQLKPGKAAETLGRFAINSTLGVGGLLEVAKRKPFSLPYRHNGFANTLGYYGVKPGPFLYLPLVGATTVRDLFGTLADAAVLPTAVGKPFNGPAYGVPAYVVTSLDSRIEFDAERQRIRNADEPYSEMRESYLKSRQREIDALRGKKAEEPAPASPPATTEISLIEPLPLALDVDLAVPAS
ncbi:MAG: MlaA family lipoprotein [Tsuneonella sp.]